MIRLLDADALIATLKRQAYSGQWSEAVVFGYERSISLIERLANECAQTEYKRPHGKIIVDEDCNTSCSRCGNTLAFGNFCCNCGADFREECKND